MAQKLRDVLAAADAGDAYDTEILKARDVLVAWDAEHDGTLADDSPFAAVEKLQKIGNDMRKHDHAAVARAFVRRIRESRARKTGRELDHDGSIEPDGRPRAYILDSIRHPAEVELLTRLYQDAFVLIGVVCEEHKRLDRLQNGKFKADASRTEVETLMKRDAKEGPKHGQRVSDAFHMAHYFLDNTENREIEGGEANPAWELDEKLSRLETRFSTWGSSTEETNKKDRADEANKKKVLFRPFVGVAPRFYQRVFRKDRELKDRRSGAFMIGPPEWTDHTHLGRVSYTELEAQLARDP